MAQRREAAPRIVVLAGHGDHLQQQQQLLLDGARALMLCGAVAVVSSVGSPAAGADTALAFAVGFVLWLAGACLLALVPVARVFPRLAGAAMAGGAVLKRCFSFTQWN